MNIVIGADHGGFDLKNKIGLLLKELGNNIIDVGCFTAESVDYPDYADSVTAKILGGEADLGILVCGTGIGMSIAANRHMSIRAAVCHDKFTTEMSREHNNANVLCLGARVLKESDALEMVKVWVETDFAGGRHQTRIDKFSR